MKFFEWKNEHFYETLEGVGKREEKVEKFIKFNFKKHTSV
jgi:hypothetical protein